MFNYGKKWSKRSKNIRESTKNLIDAIGGREHDQMRHAKTPHDGHRVYLDRLEDLNTLLESYY